MKWNTTSEFTYNDPEGRVSDFTQTISSRSNYPMTTSYSYDSLNRVTDVRYPAQYGLPGNPRKLVHNAFQIGGNLSMLTADGQAQASGLVYNAAGQTTQMKVGAGASQMTEEYSFDQQTGLMTNQKVKNSGGIELLNLSYGYQRRDGNGNLIAGKTGYLSEIDNNLDPNKDRRYEYDALGRLKKAAGGAAALGQGSSSWTQNYSYDIFGNRTNVTANGQTNGIPIPSDGIGNVSYNTLTNRITSAGFEYDYNGNQTRALAPDGQSWYRYEYDDANRLVVVKQDNGTVIQTQEFGIGNNRLSVTDSASNQRTYYQGGAVEYTESNNNGVLNWSKSYVYLEDSLLSTTTPNGAGGETVEYNHPDALGTRLVSNPQTGTITENVNLPFGTQIQNESTNSSNKRKFTSYDRSTVTGLDYAVNRTYDSKQGRFTQVDPIGMSAASLMNPQTLNLYSYCGNDPINHTDPDGLFWGAIGKFFNKVGKVFSAIGRAIKRVLGNIAVQVALIVLSAVVTLGASLLGAVSIFAPTITAPAWLTAASYISTAASWAAKIGTTLELSGLLLQGKFKQLGKIVGLAFVGAIAGIIEDSVLNGVLNAWNDGRNIFAGAWDGFKNGLASVKAAFTRKLKDLIIPVYGLWCGPGYGLEQLGSNGPDGVDGVDSKCKAHDIGLAERQKSINAGLPARTKTYYDLKLIKGVLRSTSRPRFTDIIFGSGHRVGDIYAFQVPFAFGVRIAANRGK